MSGVDAAAIQRLLDDLEAMAQKQSRVHNVDTAVGIRYAAEKLRALAAAAPATPQDQP